MPTIHIENGQDEEKLGLNDFHQILDLLLARVPTPRAMVRVLLNLAVRRTEDLVPLVPPTIGFGRGGEVPNIFGESGYPHMAFTYTTS